MGRRAVHKCSYVSIALTPARMAKRRGGRRREQRKQARWRGWLRAAEEGAMGRRRGVD